MSTNHPSHDEFVRNILSNKKIAIEYFKNYLPNSVHKHLNFKTIRQQPDTYLSDELKKSLSDIVYSCNLKGEKRSVKVVLLIEHKSHPDKYTPVQIGGYIFSALLKQIQNKEQLSLVIPVLLYHGKEKWQYQTLNYFFENLHDDLKRFLPDFEYVFNNLGMLRDSEIEELNNKFLVASFLALKHSQDKEWIAKNALQLLILASQGAKGLKKGFIIYLYSRGELKENLLNLLPGTIKNDVMNTLDIYIEKGRKEGFDKGIEKGKEEIVKNLIETGSFTISEIATLAGVSDSFVKRVKNMMNKKR